MTTDGPNYTERLLDAVGRCLSREVAQRILDLRADPLLQDRVDWLADKCSAGELTVEERAEYEQYVRCWQFISLLQAKARELLDPRSGAA